MTNQEAIRILNEQRNKFMDEWVDFGGVNEAYNMAINLLKEHLPNGKCVNECECWDSAYERGKQDALKEQESRWVSIPHKKDRVCERCGYDEPYKNAEKETMIYKFCPNCGARMKDGEVNGCTNT